MPPRKSYSLLRSSTGPKTGSTILSHTRYTPAVPEGSPCGKGGSRSVHSRETRKPGGVQLVDKSKEQSETKIRLRGNQVECWSLYSLR